MVALTDNDKLVVKGLFSEVFEEKLDAFKEIARTAVLQHRIDCPIKNEIMAAIQDMKRTNSEAQASETAVTPKKFLTGVIVGAGGVGTVIASLAMYIYEVLKAAKQ